MARYQRQSKIDSGGFGCVYRAKRLDDGEVVAFKVLEGRGITTEDRTRFIREVRIQSQLDHPHIVPILGSNVEVDPPFCVMPLASGNLRSRICDGAFGDNLKSTMHVFVQLLDGMAYAHSNGVIHRDLKPENLLFFDEEIFGEEMIRISDFGLGKRMDTESLTVTQSHIGMGTAAYMPPEQYRDFKRADHRADIYSLGKILYEMLTGELPLHVNTHHTKLPRGFGYVIGRCIEHDPDNRYQSILELKKDLLELTSDQRKFKHPHKEIETLVRAIESGHGNARTLIEEVDRLFLDNAHDAVFYTKYFVTLGKASIREYVSYSKERFLERLEDFDSFVSGNLPWSYTDTVADFYRAVWTAIEDERVRKLLLERLLDMGHSHNRWHVGTVFAVLLASIDEQEEALMARDVLLSNPPAAKWMKSYCTGGLLPVIGDGFPRE
ncbi:MAG: serine/threonine-protein kinase [Phycisphaerae bacterium]|nr:serine/threonine-protein kinase [Phycisphaerae bacterium]